jgi:hypothetical protein
MVFTLVDNQQRCHHGDGGFIAAVNISYSLDL